MDKNGFVVGEQKEVARFSGVSLVIHEDLDKGNLAQVLLNEAMRIVKAMDEHEQNGLGKVCATRWWAQKPDGSTERLSLCLYFFHRQPLRYSYSVSKSGTDEVPFFTITRTAS